MTDSFVGGVVAHPFVVPVIKVDTEFWFRLQFRPKLELEIRPLVRLWPNACFQFRPQYRLRPKPTKSVSVGF